MAPSASGAGFAQFFPAAPRAAREKATERERAKSRASLDAVDRDPRTASTAPTPPSASSATQRDGLAKPDLSTSDARHHSTSTDETESLQGDILNGVGSTSSHASTTSSVFSLPNQSASMANTSLRASNNLNSAFTPLTATGSPSYNQTPNSQQSKDQPRSASSQHPDPTKSSQGSTSTPAPAESPSSRAGGVVDRIPARDPARKMQGTKRTYDPLTDKTISSNERKTRKPAYKTFGSVCNQYYNDIYKCLEGGRHLTGV